MTSLTLFFTVLATVFIAEMGDKTQLMLIALTSKYKVRDICIGTAAAILVLNALAVIAGGILNEFLKTNLWIVKFIAAAAFFFFSLTSLLQEEEEEEETASRFSFAPLAVFTTFFVAELGDKTQLAAITFGATNGLNSDAILIWLSASIGLFAADIIGLLIGYFLHGKTPDWFFKTLAFIIFAAFGFCSLPEGIRMLNEAKNLSVPVMIPLVIAAVIFAGAVAFIIFFQRLAKKHQ